jgi:hypothetical protein
LHYAVFGRIDFSRTLIRHEYRSNGVPAGLVVAEYGPDSHPEVVESYKKGYAWDRFVREYPRLAELTAAQEYCVVVSGEIADPSTLDYLRDVVGLLAFCIDGGGVAICDLQIARWWAPDEWRRHLFDPEPPIPHNHVAVFYSPDGEGLEWIHTRGMRKFGRPDLSIHAVPPSYKDATIGLCNRFIELLALGEIIEDGREIQMSSLPTGMICHCRGSEDDLDFNNVHVEITWPEVTSHD